MKTIITSSISLFLFVFASSAFAVPEVYYYSSGYSQPYISGYYNTYPANTYYNPYPVNTYSYPYTGYFGGYGGYGTVGYSWPNVGFDQWGGHRHRGGGHWGGHRH